METGIATQADCILLVAAENSTPEVTAAEWETVWQRLMPPGSPAGSGALNPSPPARRSIDAGVGVGPLLGTAGRLHSMDEMALGQIEIDAAGGLAFTADVDAAVRGDAERRMHAPVKNRLKRRA